MDSSKLPPGMTAKEMGYGLSMENLIREAMRQGLPGDVALERALALCPDASPATKKRWAKAAGN